MSNNIIADKIPTQSELELMAIQDILSVADQNKLYLVRSRFDGLFNAYKDDVEATTMLKFLMAEYSVKQRVQQEGGSISIDPTNIH